MRCENCGYEILYGITSIMCPKCGNEMKLIFLTDHDWCRSPRDVFSGLCINGVTAEQSHNRARKLGVEINTMFWYVSKFNRLPDTIEDIIGAELDANPLFYER